MRKVIYTCISDNYDNLKEPSIVTPDWQCLCFTNNKNLRSDVWDVIYSPNIKTTKDVRRIKITPGFIYDECIWIDGSMMINCDLNNFVKEMCDADFVLMEHPDRNCIYEEAIACVNRKKDDPHIINKQIDFYKKMSYPENNGMVATGFIYRKNTERNNEVCRDWNTLVQAYSKRDQLSFNYAAYVNNFNYKLIPFSILKTDFILHKHTK